MEQNDKAGQDRRSLLTRAGVFALAVAASVMVPSRSESFGLVALEASACGVPVVASGVGGLLTLVDHGETGYLVPDRDPLMFAHYLREIIEHMLHRSGLVDFYRTEKEGADRIKTFVQALEASGRI